MEERCARDAEAAGSNPASPIMKEEEKIVHQPYMTSGAMVQMVHDLRRFMTSEVMVWVYGLRILLILRVE